MRSVEKLVVSSVPVRRWGGEGSSRGCRRRKYVVFFNFCYLAPSGQSFGCLWDGCYECGAGLGWWMFSTCTLSVNPAAGIMLTALTESGTTCQRNENRRPPPGPCPQVYNCIVLEKNGWTEIESTIKCDILVKCEITKQREGIYANTSFWNQYCN